MQDQALDHQEVEWQFEALDVRPVIHWLENGGREQEPAVTVGETREISDTYLDTEDWRIHRAGYALRLRHTKGKPGAEATMKLLASHDGAQGLKSRREISENLDRTEPGALNDAPGPVGEAITVTSWSQAPPPAL